MTTEALYQVVLNLLENSKKGNALPTLESITDNHSMLIVDHGENTFYTIKKSKFTFPGEPKTKLTQLDDTPASLSGQGYKSLVVNADGTATVFKLYYPPAQSDLATLQATYLNPPDGAICMKDDESGNFWIAQNGSWILPPSVSGIQNATQLSVDNASRVSIIDAENQEDFNNKADAKISEFESRIDALEAGGVGAGAIDDRYDNITALIADQNNQIDAGLYRVSDASDDPTVNAGRAYYEYLGTDNGTLADYYKFSEEESMDLDAEFQALQDQIDDHEARIVALESAPGGTTPTEEQIIGTAAEDLTLSGAETLDLSTFSSFKGILTGNTTITFSNLPATGKSFAKTFQIASTAAETLSFADQVIIVGEYVADGSNNYITAVFSYFPSNRKNVIYINQETV